MFEPTEIAARRICATSVNRSSRGKSAVNRYMRTANSSASTETRSFSGSCMTQLAQQARSARGNPFTCTRVKSRMADYGDLTDLQLMIMSVLWTDEEATIATIHERLNRRAVTRK